ncbi:MAG: adenylyltransferase/cytidyltransferase family protein, partial [Verrucomicrobiota bacterium]
MSSPSQPVELKRIALYGGAFDPVHLAHLEVAKAAMSAARLDRVVFIPTARSPLKSVSPRVDDAARLAMLDLALMDYSESFVVDSCELERGGISYSHETVSIFR